MPDTTAPVIQSVTATPNAIQPGQVSTIQVSAMDPDSQSGTVSVTVKDAAGNSSTATTTLTVGDPLTYMCTTNVPAWTVTQDVAIPSKFYVQA